MVVATTIRAQRGWSSPPNRATRNTGKLLFALALATVDATAIVTGTVTATAQEPRPTLQQEIDRALDRALPALRRHLQEAKGGELALLVLAAVHDGRMVEEPAFAQALQQLLASKLTGTYELALRLMVLAELPQVADRERRAAADLARLLENQASSGGFSYSARPHDWDLSNTQYAALGLRAAAALGLDVPSSAWRAMLRAAFAVQDDSGGFAYRPRGVRFPYTSMTVAGIGVLEICTAHLRGSDRDASVERRLRRAWEWMAQHRAEIGSPAARSCLYFHYGLERAAILSEVREVGDVDWYAAGARMLVDGQLPSGGWNGRPEPPAKRTRPLEANAVDTAFAVLFLRRKFQRANAAVTGSGGWFAKALPEDAGKADVDRTISLEVERGLRAVPDLLKAMRSPVAVRRRAAAAALAKIAGQGFGYDPAADPAAPQAAAAIKAAERWWLVEGRQELRPARVAPPPQARPHDR